VTNPSLSIGDLVVSEGDSGTNSFELDVRLSLPSTNTVTVNYSTQNGTATAPLDLIASSGLITFPPGSTNQKVTVSVRGDTSYETNETFFVVLSGSQNAAIGDNQGAVTILNDDPLPLVSISDVSVTEGNSGTTNAVFRVSLSAPNGLAVVVRYSTSNGTARAGADYVPRNGTLTFSPGTLFLTQSLTIQVVGDTIPESNELFYVNLTSISNGILAKAQGIGTILNDEGFGVFYGFGWNQISSPQSTNIPIAVTVTAQDFFGTPVTNFNGTANLRGAIGQPQIQGTLFPTNITHDFSDPSGPYTFAVAFTPSADITVTHARHYTGSEVTLWTDDGAPLATQPVVSTPGTWTETPFATPVPLHAGTTYRISYFQGNDSYYYTTNLPTSFDHGAIGETYWASGNAFPQNPLGQALFLVDLRYSLGVPAIPVAVTPVTIGPFTNGVWNGFVSVLQQSTNVHVEADDGQNHAGASNPFDVVGPSQANIGVVIRGTNFVHTGSNIVLVAIVTNRGPASATATVLTNSLPPDFIFVSALPTQGACTNADRVVICDLGTLPPRAAAVVSLALRAGPTGATQVSADVGAAQPDPVRYNNSARFALTVYRDTDSDGIWDEWEITHGMRLDDPTDAALDPDDDGHTNLQEFQAGTDPHDAASVKLLTRLVVENGEVQIGFRGKIGSTYRVDYSDDLTHWILVSEFRLNTNEIELLDSLPGSVRTRYYRASRITGSP
jgi:uncharacterized repeat protein (TIGR01451 family)